MTHFSVVVCLDDKDGKLAAAARAAQHGLPDGEDVPAPGGNEGLLRRQVEARLERVMAPWDENDSVAPYRVYEDGGPEDNWLYRSLKKAAEVERNGTVTTSELSRGTPGEQRAEAAREAALFRTLPEPVTWEAIIDAGSILYPDEGSGLQVDEEDGRAYRMSTYNPGSKWDYWRIGGRWGGYFTRKADSDGAFFLLPEKDWDSPDTFGFHSADAGPKGLLDLDAMREKAAAQAAVTYREYHALVDHLPEALPWRVFADNISEGSGYTVDRAREEYRAQPRVQAVTGTEFAWGDNIEAFGVSEGTYLNRARAGAVPGFALVTADGRWVAPGEMGWFGINDASDDTRARYWETANAYIEALPDSTWLVAVDCHI